MYKRQVESNSIASQRAICEDYIARHEDLELVCEPFVDDGYSGVSFNRPQFKKLEEAIHKGALDCIVVKDLSRFSRNYIDGGRYIEKIFPQLGIRFIAINDAYDSLTGDPQSDSFVIPFKNLINDSYCKDCLLYTSAFMSISFISTSGSSRAMANAMTVGLEGL